MIPAVLGSKLPVFIFPIAAERLEKMQSAFAARFR
jgi:hypothetical protein